MKFIKLFNDITLKDVALVGGKNASLGQMISQLTSQGINVPLGFAITAEAYWHYLDYNNLVAPLKHELELLTNPQDITTLQKVGERIRNSIITGTIFPELIDEITQAYNELCAYYKQFPLDVAIRSSATAEDLPHASFAGQQETYLNIAGIENVLEACKKCMASLFTDRAIIYRIEKGFDHLSVGISIGIQKMIRSDKASSGVIFTLDTDSGFRNVVVITSSYGLGENIVKGIVTPDEFHVHKPTLTQGFKPIVKKHLGTKEFKLVYTNTNISGLENIPVSLDEQHSFSLTDSEILTLARQSLIIEHHYSQLYGYDCAMDIEWAKDGIDHNLYIVQARPETIHTHKKHNETLTRYHLNQANLTPIATGRSIGHSIAHGTVRILHSLENHTHFSEGDILVASMTDPDWVPLMKKAAAIVTDRGGRTCHAAIVSRELGIPAIVGTGNATKITTSGTPITVDCSQGAVGYIYNGIHDFSVETTSLKTIPTPPVPVLLNIADPDRAYELSFLPVSGVGLARVEFIITNFIKVHPMAVCDSSAITDKALQEKIQKLAYPYEDPKNFFIQTLAQGIATIAAAFYPRSVTVRLSDFKSNEYRNLLGGHLFEPLEENPMLGFRGAVRYCEASYAPAFALECAALLKARNEMGLTNIKIMVPFVRTLDEAACTLQALKEYTLISGNNGLEILMMCEIPANVLLLKKFNNFFDGFSIGSNDLTQLTLGVDRDSALLASIFDERDPAVKEMLSIAIRSANECGSFISICGQAPSDFPELADFLIQEGIKALSLNPDSVIPFLLRYKS